MLKLPFTSQLNHYKMNRISFLLISFLITISFVSIGQNLNLPGVIVQAPRTKAIWHVHGLDAHLHTIMLESAVNMNGIFNVVDNDDMDNVLAFRKKLFKEEEELSSSQMIGADYILESKVLDFSEVNNKYYEQIKQEDGSFKEGICSYKSKEVTIKLNMSLVSVETSDVVSSREFEVSGFAYKKCKDFRRLEDEVVRECIADFRPCFKKIFRVNMMDLLGSQIKVVGILESKKESAKKLIIKSGSLGNIHPGAKLNVISISSQEVEGKNIRRESQIGSAEISNLRDGYSILKVKKGGEEIYKSLMSDGELYVSYGKNYRLVDCNKKNQPRSRRQIKDWLEPN